MIRRYMMEMETLPPRNSQIYCSLTGVESDFLLPSPRILQLRWGLLEVEKIDEDTGCRKASETIKYRDAKLWPGGSQAWDWKEYGTTHRRGITLEDVTALYGTGAQTIVLSMGKMSWLHVPHFVVTDLERDGYNIIIKPTSSAVQTYNKLAESGHPVAGLFHTTC